MRRAFNVICNPLKLNGFDGLSKIVVRKVIRTKVSLRKGNGFGFEFLHIVDDFFFILTLIRCRSWACHYATTIGEGEGTREMLL